MSFGACSNIRLFGNFNNPPTFHFFLRPGQRSWIGIDIAAWETLSGSQSRDAYDSLTVNPRSNLNTMT
jgi:hypothetical protein